LENWESLACSDWVLRWAPSWSMQVSFEGVHYVRFKCLLRIHDFKVLGKLRLRASSDLSVVGLAFLEPPRFRLRTECSVSWGSVPLPLKTFIEAAIYEEFRRWLNENMVAPHEVSLRPPGFQRKQGLSDADLEKARRAVALARQYSAARQSSN